MPNKKSKKTIESISDTVLSETETQLFWQTHQLSEASVLEPVSADLKNKLTLARSRHKSRNISLNLSANLEQRLKKLAELKHLPYQTLLKDFVLERVYEEEKRMGVV